MQQEYEMVENRSILSIFLKKSRSAQAPLLKCLQHAKKLISIPFLQKWILFLDIARDLLYYVS